MCLIKSNDVSKKIQQILFEVVAARFLALYCLKKDGTSVIM